MHSSLLQIFALNISATRFFWRACILSLILALAAFLSTARAVTPAPLRRDRALHDPCRRGMGSRPVFLSIQIRPLDHIAQLCLRRPVQRARYSNRSTFYCEACQV